MVLYVLSNLGDCLNFIAFVLALPQAFAEDRPASTVDLGMSEVSNGLVDAFSGIRLAPATLPLVSSYQAQGSSRWTGRQMIWDGTLAHRSWIRVQVQSQWVSSPICNRRSTTRGDALPGWKLPDEDLIRDFADLGITACGRGIIYESSIWFGNECHIFGANLSN